MWRKKKMQSSIEDPIYFLLKSAQSALHCHIMHIDHVDVVQYTYHRVSHGAIHACFQGATAATSGNATHESVFLDL